MRIIGLIVTTFIIAMIYGIFVATVDFTGLDAKIAYDPVISGHRAAKNVYALFGTANNEIKQNEGEAPQRGNGIAHKVAMPYAVTADLSAIVGGKVEVGMSTLFHHARNQIQPNTRTVEPTTPM